MMLVSEGSDDAEEFQDRNYAQYMNRGDGRYVKLMEDQAEGSFGPDKDHGGETRRIHRQKSAIKSLLFRPSLEYFRPVL